MRYIAKLGIPGKSGVLPFMATSARWRKIRFYLVYSFEEPSKKNF